MNLKLGKRAPRYDPKTPYLAKHLRPSHLVSPPQQNWGRPEWVGYWGMMLNDQLGDCVIASKGHGIILYTTLTGAHHNVILPDAEILAGYVAVGGYVPGDPSTDNGCDMLTAAKYYLSTGFGGHRISAYAAIAPCDVSTMQAAVNLFGYVDLGIQLPWYSLHQFESGAIWDIDPKGDQTIAGGHDVPIVGYDRDEGLYTVVTWGRLQTMTQKFLLNYADEALTYLAPDWIFNGRAPNKYDLWQLQADLLAA